MKGPKANKQWDLREEPLMHRCISEEAQTAEERFYSSRFQPGFEWSEAPEECLRNDYDVKVFACFSFAYKGQICVCARFKVSA